MLIAALKKNIVQKYVQQITWKKKSPWNLNLGHPSWSEKAQGHLIVTLVNYTNGQLIFGIYREEIK